MATPSKHVVLFGLIATLLITGGAIAVRLRAKSPDDERMQEIKRNIEQELRARLLNRPAVEASQLLMAEIRAAAKDDAESMFTKEM